MVGDEKTPSGNKTEKNYIYFVYLLTIIVRIESIQILRIVFLLNGLCERRNACTL